ncbi:ADP,ATP carrier protein 1 [Chlamydiales bacterium STE3]|nr:ADP,ATP carrier protein 1 [Chlamydiales bacterium STE3]
MASIDNSKFGTLRSLFWPIYRHERRNLVPMLLMLFLICFNYSILRTIKDVILVTAAGAEVIPFIKVWAIFPMAILVTLIFTQLSNKFTQEKVFYFMVSGFLAFYAFFAFFLYPAREAMHCNQLADYLQQILPAGCKGMIFMLRYWSFTAFYVMSELWSTSIMTVLFWGLANEITKLTEAKRFYSVLSIGSNFASIAAGIIAGQVTHLEGITGLLIGKDSWEQALMILVSLIVISGIITMLIYRWMSVNVLNSSSQELDGEEKPIFKQKERLSLREGLSYVLRSNYLTCIAVIVVSYNLVINLVDVVWKDQLGLLYPSKTEYNDHLSHLLIMQGVLSTLLAVAMSQLINLFGWTKTALITPIVMLITCLGFFGFLFFQNQITDLALFSFLGMSPLAIAVYFGSIQNATIKAAKYSVFDATKEMSYIPLSHECKLQGKTAIDGIGSRFGKFGGSVIHQLLLLFFVTVGSSAPIVATILIGVIAIWIVAVRALGRQFAELNPQSDLIAREKVDLKEKPHLVT